MELFRPKKLNKTFLNFLSPKKINKTFYNTCLFSFYKHIKIQELGSDMLKATQNIGWILTVLDKSLRVLQLPTHLSNLNANK